MLQYKYEPRLNFVIIIIFIFIIIIFVVRQLTKKNDEAPLPLEYIEQLPVAAAATSIIICIPQNRQLENVNLIIHDFVPRLINIPVNPTLIESKIDGTMVRKITIDRKILYKIQLPREYKIRELTLDMYTDVEESVFIFMENLHKRTWEKNIKITAGRYHKITMRNINNT